MRYFLSLLISFTLFASTETAVDTLYKDTLRSLSTLLREVDMALGDSNKTDIKQRFNIRTALSVISESRKGTKFKLSVKANLSLPRTQKRINLFLSDYRRSDSIDENTNDTLTDTIKNTSFLLGLQYMTKHNLRYKAGIRFRNISPDPFVAVEWEDTSYISSKSWIYYGDRLYYYSKNRLDNQLFVNFQLRNRDKAVWSFENSYRFEQEPDLEHQFTHTLAYYLSLGRYETLVPKIEFYFNKNSHQGYKLNYFFGGAEYESRIFRKWLFYQISALMIFRNEYSFKPGIRTTFTIGITFEQH